MQLEEPERFDKSNALLRHNVLMRTLHFAKFWAVYNRALGFISNFWESAWHRDDGYGCDSVLW